MTQNKNKRKFFDNLQTTIGYKRILIVISFFLIIYLLTSFFFDYDKESFSDNIPPRVLHINDKQVNNSLSSPPPPPITQIPDDGYFVGSYYMPKPKYPTHQWNSLLAFNRLNADYKREPLLGYYSGDDVLAMNWQIYFAKENGLDFFVFNNYWTESQNTPVYEDSKNSFKAAPLNSSMQFANLITLINASTPTKQQEIFLNDLLNYYKSEFNTGNYVEINGEKLFVIFNTRNVLGLDYNNTNDAQKIKEILVEFEQKIGMDIYWAYAGPDEGRSNFDIYLEIGFETLFPYGMTPDVNFRIEPKPHWDSDSNGDGVVDWQITEKLQQSQKDRANLLQEIDKPFDNRYAPLDYTLSKKIQIEETKDSIKKAANSGLHYIPNFTTNFDERNRYLVEPFLKNRHPLRYTKTDEQSGVSTLPSSMFSLKRFLNISNQSSTLSLENQTLIGVGPWNEWIEGSYIEPGTGELRYQNPYYVSNIFRNVFHPMSRNRVNVRPPRFNPVIPVRHQWNFLNAEDRELLYLDVRNSTNMDSAGQFTLDKGNLMLILPTKYQADSSNVFEFVFKQECSVENCLRGLNLVFTSTNCPGYNTNKCNTSDTEALLINNAPEDNLDGTNLNIIDQCEKDSQGYTVCRFEINSDKWINTIESIRIIGYRNLPNQNLADNSTRISEEEPINMQIKSMRFITDECPDMDSNQDGILDRKDLATIVDYYAKACMKSDSYSSCGSIDANRDGQITIIDLSVFLAIAGKTCVR